MLCLHDSEIDLWVARLLSYMNGSDGFLDIIACCVIQAIINELTGLSLYNNYVSGIYYQN